MLLTPRNGVRFLEPAPAADVRVGSPPLSRNDHGCGRYLWVIDARGIPYIIEAPIPAIHSALPKHTNLTGGKEAYLGGEMWFASDAALYVSGGSGRYPPVDGSQLEEATQVFQSFGYAVTSLGWDDEGGSAMRYLEDSEWLT